MKVLILAGGYGTRLSEETVVRPKPMIEIGEKPILWHIMKLYSHHGFNDFIILLGYKGYFIKEYFVNYFVHQNDIKIDLKNNKTEILNNKVEPWKITLIDTGLDSMTGHRIKCAQPYINTEDFMVTYGDGVSDININELYDFHKNHSKLVTMTVVQPEGKYGAVNIRDEDTIERFEEKPVGDNSWVNGGFFVCKNKVLDYIDDDIMTVFEREPLELLAKKGHLKAFKHKGFWKCMDTQRDKMILNNHWYKNRAEWKVWKD